MNAAQLRSSIIRPALEAIGFWSQAAEDLVAGTAAQESRLKYFAQLGGGPGIGIWQFEPPTHNDIWENYLLPGRSTLAIKLWAAAGVDEIVPFRPPHDWLAFNLRYAAALCRIHYRRQPGRLPTTIQGMARYWKRYYNTSRGRGTESEFIESYKLVDIST